MLKFIKVSLLLFLTNLIALSGQGQKTESYRDPALVYRSAVEHFSHKQYESARELFSDYMGNSSDKSSEIYINSTYYKALCSMKLFHKDSEYLMENFVNVHPESIWILDAKLNLASYNFNRRDYDDAIYWYDQIDPRDLSESQREELQFNTGFAAFQIPDYQKSKLSFFELKDKEGQYQAASSYYYGYIVYSEGNYETALQAFNKAGEDPNFENVVPYYIAQIYHFQERYDELIEYAPGLLEREDIVRESELSLLLGNAYYQKEEYTKALPYLEAYAKSKPNINPHESYQIAYTYYRNQNYSEAIKFFKKASSSTDNKLAQISTYQLADSYLRLGEKKYAQNAFQVASQFNADSKIKEDALFNYAKLAYELSYDPFHEAIVAFEEYLENYPNSDRKDEAYEFLIRVFVATKNYSGAINALDKLKILDSNKKILYQECAYNLAVETIAKGEIDNGFIQLKEVTRYNPNPKLSAQGKYWEGDLHYKNKNYNKAISSYNEFLANSAAYQTEYYNLANYNIGYCHFKLSNHNESLVAFRKYVSSAGEDTRRKNDAYLRVGDLNLVSKDYKKAIDNYGLAMNSDNMNADYALFQTAQAFGFQENFDEKIKTLNSLLKEYPETTLAAVGNYELGDSYFMKNNLGAALGAFNTLVNDYPNSPYRKKALLKKGLVEYRKGEFENAISTFKKVVAEYGVDSESNEAIATLKNIYLDLDRVDEYSEWLNAIPDYTVSPKEIDSLSYQVAENYISEGDCDKAIDSFDKYLEKYPTGLFVLNAHYYIADCAYRRNNFDLAITNFEIVTSKPANQFSEPALFGAASIRYSQSEFDLALTHYQDLKAVSSFESNSIEAEIGIMRCANELGQYELALKSIQNLKENQGIPTEILNEVEITEGRIHFAQGNYAEALPIMQRLAEKKNTAIGAEAQYNLAKMTFDSGNLEKSENQLFSLIQDFPGQDKWKIQGFLLLSDVYAAKEDFFQARATLQSIITNVKDSIVISEAEQKLARIDDLEKELIERSDTIPGPDTMDYENDYEELIKDQEIPENE